MTKSRKFLLKLTSCILSVTLLSTALVTGAVFKSKAATIAPKMLNNCDSFTNWANESSYPCSLDAIDEINKTQGAGSIKGSTTSVGDWFMFYMTVNAADTDFTEYSYLEFDFYSEKAFSSTGSLIVTLQGAPESGAPDIMAPVAGWNHCKIALSSFSVQSTLSSVPRIRFASWSAPVGNIMNFDNVRLTDGVTEFPAAHLLNDCEEVKNVDRAGGPGNGPNFTSVSNASFTVSNEATQGAHSLELPLGGGDRIHYYPDTNDTASRDVRPYEYFEYDVWFPEDVTFPANSTGGYFVSEGKEVNVFFQTAYTYKAGWNHMTIPMDVLFEAPPTGFLTQWVSTFGVCFWSSPKNVTVRIDNLRLTHGDDDRTTLESISVSGGYTLNETFDRYKTNYTMTVGSATSSVTIDGVTTVPGASVSASGNTSLVEGSVIIVTVASQFGPTREYKINVSKSDVLPPKMLNNCESATQFNTNYGNIQSTFDAINSTEGYYSAKAGFSDNYSQIYFPLDSLDISGGKYQYLEYDIYTPKAFTTNNSFNFCASDNPAAAGGIGGDGYNYLERTNLTAGWNRIKVNIDTQFSADGRTVDLSDLNGVRIALWDITDTSGEYVLIDNIRLTNGQTEPAATLAILTAKGSAGGQDLIEFDPFVTTYDINAPEGVTSLILDYTKTVDTAAVSVSVTGNVDFAYGAANKVTISVTNAASLQTRNYYINVTVTNEPAPRLVCGFETGDNLRGDFGSYSGLDFINSTQGQSSAQIISEADGTKGQLRVTYTAASPVDIRGYTYLEFDLWLNKPLDIGTLQVWMTAPDTANTISFVKSNGSFVQGWQHVKIPVSEASPNGLPNWRTINIMTFDIWGASDSNFVARFDNAYMTNSVSTDKLESLTSLNVDGKTLTPAFDPNITEYYLEYPDGTEAQTLSVTAAAFGAPDATVSIAGKAIKPGSNKLTVTVTSKLGTTRVYTVKVKLGSGADPQLVNGYEYSGTPSDLEFGNGISYLGIDKANSTQGQSSISFAAEASSAAGGAGGTIHQYLTTPMDISSYDNFEFDLWVDQDMTPGSVEIFLLGPGPTAQDTVVIELLNKPLTKGWNHITMPISTARTVVGTEFNPANVKIIRVAVWNSKIAAGFTAKVDNLYLTCDEINDETLSSLSFGVGTLSPAYNRGFTMYTLELPAGAVSQTIAVNAVAAQTGATVAVTGNSFDPAKAVNTINVTVTSKYGTKRTYYVDVVVAGVPRTTMLYTAEATSGVSPVDGSGTTFTGLDLENRTEGRSSANLKADGNKFGANFDFDFAMNLSGAEYFGIDIYFPSAGTADAKITLLTGSTAADGVKYAQSGLAFTAGWNRIKIPKAAFTAGAFNLSSIGTVRVEYINSSVANAEIKVDNVRVLNGNYNDDATLSAFTLGGGLNYKETFNADKAIYNIDIVKAITSLTVNGTAKAAGSTIKVEGNENIPREESLVIVTVTTPYRTECVYTIVVVRDRYITIDGIMDDKYTKEKSVTIDNTFAADGVTPCNNLKNASTQVYYAYDEDSIFFYVICTQDSFNGYNVGDYKGSDCEDGNMIDHLEMWINPDPSYDFGEMIDSALHPDTLDGSPRFFPGDGTIYIAANNSKTSLINSKTAVVTMLSDTQYAVELKYPRDKTEGSFKFTASQYVSESVEKTRDDGTKYLSPVSTVRGFYNVAPVSAWWRFASQEFEIFFDDMDGSIEETPSYVTSSDDRVTILNNSFVVHEDMDIDEMINCLEFASGISYKFFDVNGNQITDFSKNTDQAAVIRLYKGSELVHSLYNVLTNDKDEIPDENGSKQPTSSDPSNNNDPGDDDDDDYYDDDEYDDDDPQAGVKAPIAAAIIIMGAASFAVLIVKRKKKINETV